MSEPKFTPEELEVRTDWVADEVWIAPKGSEEGGCAVAKMCGAYSYDEKVRRAKHLAAAPELYQFIEMVRDAARDAVEDGVAEEWARETARRANAMLAKARGEEVAP